MKTEAIYGARHYFGLVDVANGVTISATIESADIEKRLDPSGLTAGNLRIVLTLDGHERRLALNTRNARVLALAFGEEPGKWPGHRITLYGVMEPFRGVLRPALRVRAADPDPSHRPGFVCAARAALSNLFDGGAK